MLLCVDRLKRRMCSFVDTRAATAGAVGVDRHVVWLEGRRGTFHNACLGGSKLLLQLGFGGLNAFAARFWILDGALCSSRSTLDLGGSSARGCVAVWDWRLMGQCCVFRQLHTDSATSVSQSRVLLRLCRPKRWRLVARGRGGPVPIGARHAHFVSRSRRPGIEPVSRVFTLDGRE